MIKTFSNEFGMYKKEESMRCENVEMGIILPRVIASDAPMWGLGGVCNSANDFVELSAYDGGWAKHGGKYEWQQEEYLDEEVVYFGLFLKHWGHFLVDLVGRGWYLPGISKNIKVAYIGEEELAGNYKEFFELLDIEEERLIHITKPTRCEKVIVPEFSMRPCIWYSDEFTSIFDYLEQKIRTENYVPNNLPPLEKVYFSRMNFGKAVQSEFGESHIAEWLIANNYSIISPEKLSLRDQIYVWNHAKEIVCINGSIPINVVFSKNKELKLVVLNKTSLIHKNLELFLLMRNGNTTLMDVYLEPFKGYPKSIGAGPFLIGISDDICEYSNRYNMTMPFSEKEIRLQWKIGKRKLFWCIMDVKGKIRCFISNIIPESVKRKIRTIRK